MKSDDKNTNVLLGQKSLKNRQQTFNELLSEKQAKAEGRAAREQQDRKDQARIGCRMPDGTIFAGASPATGKPMYAMPADAPLSLRFNEASEYAKAVNTQKAYGYDDWRVPTKAELNVLFNNRAEIGRFDVSGDESGYHPAGRYWSTTPDNDMKLYAWCQQFSDGVQVTNYLGTRLSVRCVR